MAAVKPITVRREAHIAAPPERIWPLVDDPEELGRWLAFADSIEPLEGEGVGRRQRLHGHWGRRRSEIDQEVIVHEPPRAFAWRHVAERLDGKPAPRFAAETLATVTLAPDGPAGAVVSLESRQLPAGRLKGLVMRAFGRREVARRIEQSLAELRASAERD